MKIGLKFEVKPKDGLERYQKKVKRATARAIDRTMKEAAQQARRHHPGWETRTGTAERDIDIVAAAHASPAGEIMGQWGSIHAGYGGYLERKRDGAMRAAGRAVYPKLRDHLRKELRRA